MKEFPTAVIALAEKWAREANVVPPDVHPNHIANILQLSPFGPEITKEQWIGWVKIYRGYRDQELQPKLAAEEATKEWFQMLPGQEPIRGTTDTTGILPPLPPEKPFTLTITFYVEAFKHDITIVGISGTELLTKVHGVLQAIKNIGGQAWYEMQAVTPAPTPKMTEGKSDFLHGTWTMYFVFYFSLF